MTTVYRRVQRLGRNRGVRVIIEYEDAPDENEEENKGESTLEELETSGSDEEVL